MVLANRIFWILFLIMFMAPPVHASSAAKKPSGSSQDTLKQYVDELKKNPGDSALREKIIKLAAGMKPAPAVPEEAERNMARGTAFAQKATDAAGYKKTITEFEAALTHAPWLALAYFNLAVTQERAGLMTEAIQNFKYYLLAAPDAKNARDVKNKIYALEADVEDMKATKGGAAAAAPPAADAAAAAATAKGLTVASKPSLEIEPEKELIVIKMPPATDKKSKIPSFVGSWFFKDTLRGEEATIQAFEITKNANGDLVAVAPKRTTDYIPNVRVFDIKDKTLLIDIHWRMKSVTGYWKIESYNLTLSDDGTKLAGSYNQKSVGGRNIEVDRVLFRQ